LSSGWASGNGVLSALNLVGSTSRFNLPEDSLNLVTGSILAIFTLIGAALTGGMSFSLSTVVVVVLSASCAAISLIFAVPSTLQSTHKVGFVAGYAVALLAATVGSSTRLWTLVAQVSFGIFAYIADYLDLKMETLRSHERTANCRIDQERKGEVGLSEMTIALLKACEQWPFVYGILKEKDSRRIFYFMRSELSAPLRSSAC
jgi:zinc transporter 5/7